MDAMESTLQIMREGDKRMNLSAMRDIIVMLGLTGAGKSTVAALLTSDNSKMTSKKIAPGVYIIEDDKKKISSSKSVFTSHTAVPEMLIDESTGAVFYDCPGFKDSRNSSMEIASAFFMKKVLNHAEKVKLVFVVDHKTVSQTSSRTEFPELLEHATELLKRVDKFKDSIGVIFTKVHNEYEKKNKVLTLIDDDTTIETVARFLGTSIAAGGGISDQEMIEFVNATLTKEDGKYSKMSLFRVPDEEGPLSNIESAQIAKNNINQMIHRHLKFTPSNEHDFDYAISKGAKLHLVKMWENIGQQIQQKLTYSMEKIKQHFENEEKLASEPEALKMKYQEASDQLSMIVKTPGTSTELLELLKNTQNFIKDCNIKDSDQWLMNIVQLGENIKIIQVVDPKQDIDKSFPSITEPIKDMHQLFIQSKSWFTFLMTLKGVTSSSYQRLSISQAKYNSIKAKLASLVSGETSTTGHDLVEFINQVLPNTFGHDLIKDVVVNSVRARMLNEILESTVTSSPTSGCINGNKLRITALDLKLSDALAIPGCPQGTEFMEIFVGKKLLIDADIIKIGSGLNLVIVAPTWEVLGQREIRLDGNDAPAHWLTPAFSGSSGTVGRLSNIDSAESGHDGVDGLPGFPGGNGGNFYGLADEILNGGDLTISVDGGDGGSGQDGGNGGNGADADEDTLRLSQGRVIAGCFLILSCVAYKKEIKGGSGGFNGRGGIGGLGGYAGNIHVVTKKPAPYKTFARNGTAGADGLGGRGGLSGKNSRYGTTTIWNQNYRTEDLYQTPRSSARNTISGKNYEGRQYPPIKSNPDFEYVLGDYENYVRNINEEYGGLKISTTWTENRGRRDTRGINPIGSHHFYSSLHLMDLIVRKCTKVKLPHSYTEGHSDGRFIDPVILTTEFEDLLNELRSKQGKPNHYDDFDPIAMMEDLRELMQKNRHEDICKTLYARLEEFGLSSTIPPDYLLDRIVGLLNN